MTDNTLDKEIDEVLYQTIQFTELGNFPEAVPADRSWVNVMGKVYAYDFTLAKSKLTSLIADREKKMLEFVIGKDEKNFDWKKNRGMKPDLATPARNKLRTEQRQRAKEWRGR